MNYTPQQLYLDLLKKTLAYSLWPEPPIPIELYNYRRPYLKQKLVSIAASVLRIQKLRLVREVNFSKDDRDSGAIWPGLADSMIGAYRLSNIQHCCETVLREQVPGDLIETGAWRGGACILMRAVLKVYGDVSRKVYVADSFEGLPKPDEALYPADIGDTHHIHEPLAVSLEEVKNNFRKYDLLDDQVVFLKGWFKDTLPKAPMQQLSILRLDGDMYGSTMDALTHLYPKLSSGGFCIIDDYALPGCKQAVDDFRRLSAITAALEEIDFTGRFWRK